MYLLSFFSHHNSGVSLFKDGKILFNIEEERLNRHKYSGAPFKSLLKVLEYTKKIDCLVFNGNVPVNSPTYQVDHFDGENVYIFYLERLGLIDRKTTVLDLGNFHHLCHGAGAYLKSGFREATSVVVDGSGTIRLHPDFDDPLFETESVFHFRQNDYTTVFKKYGTYHYPDSVVLFNDLLDYPDFLGDEKVPTIVSSTRGIVKNYESATQLLGWNPLEAGKTMGLSSYGHPNSRFNFFEIGTLINDWIGNNRYGGTTYPYPHPFNSQLILNRDLEYPIKDYLEHPDLKDMCFELQRQTQEQVLNLILRGVDTTNCKNVTLSGGYGLNVVANTFILKELNKRKIKYFVDPLSSDAGLYLGGALFLQKYYFKSRRDYSISKNINLGFKYSASKSKLTSYIKKYPNLKIEKTGNSNVVHLLKEGKCIGFFQGRSENGPRALGYRSILFDPRILNGKDIVNRIKRRENFRPFAGSVLEEEANNWFDMNGLTSSPFMMYALDVKEDKQNSIPSIVHVDGTCRVQTVSESQNTHFYNLIKTFYNQTSIPILLNTSFNLAGQPLVETPEDAIEVIANSELNYIYFPESELLISKLYD